MAIYTKANNIPTEAIYVDSCSRITTQEAMFLNPKNVYWGLFEGRFNISSGTIANVVIDNATFRYPLKFEDLSANYMKAVTAVLSDAYVNNLSVDSMSSVTFVDLTAYNSHTGSTYSMTFKDVYDNIALSIETLGNNLSTEIDNLSAALSGEIDTLSAKLSGEIDSLSTDLSTEISSLAKSLSVEGVLVKNKLSFGYDKNAKQIQFQVYDISGNQYLSSINTRDFADDYVVSCARIEKLSGDNYLVIYWNNTDPDQVSTAIPLSSLAQTYTGGIGISVSTTPTEDEDENEDAGLSYKISVTDYVATYKQLSDVSTVLSNDLSTKIWIENKVDQSKSPGFSDLSIVTLSKEQYAEAMANKSPYGNMDGNTLYLISSDNLDMFSQKIENLTMSIDNVPSEAVNYHFAQSISDDLKNQIDQTNDRIDDLLVDSRIQNLSAHNLTVDNMSVDFSKIVDKDSLSSINDISTSLYSQLSNRCWIGSSIDAAPRTNLNVGDVAIVSGYITTDVATSAELSTRTAYYWNGNDWAAMDGNYNTRNIYFDNNLSMDGAWTRIGNFEKSDKVISSEGKSLQWLFEKMFDVTIPPILSTDPEYSIQLNGYKLSSYNFIDGTSVSDKTTPDSINYCEVGSIVIPKYQISYSQGKYYYQWQVGNELVNDGTHFTSAMISCGVNEIYSEQCDTTSVKSFEKSYQLSNGTKIGLSAYNGWHSAGSQPVDSKGLSTDSSGALYDKREAGELKGIKQTSKTINGAFKIFYGQMKTPFKTVNTPTGLSIDISTIGKNDLRNNLPLSGWSITANSTIIPTTAGMTQIGIACKSGMYSSITVQQATPPIDIELNKSNSTIIIYDAGKNEQTYDLFYMAKPEEASGSNTFTITKLTTS